MEHLFKNYQMEKKPPVKGVYSAAHELAHEIYEFTDKSKGEYGRLLGRIKQLGLSKARAKWQVAKGLDYPVRYFMSKDV